MGTQPDPLVQTVAALIDHIDALRTYQARPGEFRWFEAVSRAALVKSYDFAAVVGDLDDSVISPFYVVGTLRGVVEDVITLTAIAGLPEDDREELLQRLMMHEVDTGLERQTAFFSEEARFQFVLGRRQRSKEETDQDKARLRDIWMRNSLDPGRDGTGNVRALAKRAKLEDLYLYIYSLASRLVHFSPSVLLRMGWGEVDDEGAMNTVFRPSNFSRYYAAAATGYAYFLLAEFIERLGQPMSLADPFLDAAASIRDELGRSRLPELVTHEEMNHDAPNVVARAFEQVVRSRSK